MKDLSSTAAKFYKAITTVNDVYISHINKLANIVEAKKKTDWSAFSEEERLITENTALLVNLLFNMGKVQLVLASGNEKEPNKVNNVAIDKSIADAETFLGERGMIGAL